MTKFPDPRAPARLRTRRDTPVWHLHPRTSSEGQDPRPGILAETWTEETWVVDADQRVIDFMAPCGSVIAHFTEHRARTVSRWLVRLDLGGPNSGVMGVSVAPYLDPPWAWADHLTNEAGFPLSDEGDVMTSVSDLEVRQWLASAAGQPLPHGQRWKPGTPTGGFIDQVSHTCLKKMPYQEIVNLARRCLSAELTRLNARLAEAQRNLERALDNEEIPPVLVQILQSGEEPLSEVEAAEYAAALRADWASGLERSRLLASLVPGHLEEPPVSSRGRPREVTDDEILEAAATVAAQTGRDPIKAAARALGIAPKKVRYRRQVAQNRGWFEAFGTGTPGGTLTAEGRRRWRELRKEKN